MKYSRRTLALVSAVSIVLLALIAALPVSIPLADVFVTKGGVRTVPIAPIIQGTTVTQEVPARGNAIHSVSLQLATYQRVNTGPLFLTLSGYRNGTWETLATLQSDKAALQDNQYHTFVFPTPIPIGSAQRVGVTLTTDGDEKTSIGWWTNPDWQEPGYNLAVNGVIRPGTAFIIVSYQPLQGRVVTQLPLLWERITVFLSAPWQGLLALALLGILVTVAVYIADMRRFGQNP